MFNDVVNFKEVAADEEFPKVMMVEIIGPECEVDEVDCEAFDKQCADEVTY
jgi:hypothetical protein